MSRLTLDLHPAQQDFLDSSAAYRGFVGGRGAGKALALDTPIPTLYGWSTMGLLCVGDVVFDEVGQPCSVVAVTEVMYKRPCYAVRFSDGSVITADTEHEWLTDTHASRKSAGRYKGTGRLGNRYQCERRSFATVKTTAEIATTMLYGNRELNHSIDVCQPLRCPNADLPIGPYTLGAWLGDGVSTYARITCADTEILDNIIMEGYGVELCKQISQAGEYAIFVPGKRRARDERTGQYTSEDGNLLVELRRLGVLGNKYIPAAYLRASIAQRWALLQGLMDTDGTASERGICEYCTTNKALAEGVFELCASLGIKATLREGRAKLYGKDCGPKYRVCFTAYTPVFRVARKAARQHIGGNQKNRQLRRYIESVTPVPSVPVRCIEVDSPSHLYLAGRTMIPTHNSYIGALDLLLRAQDDRLYGVYAPTYGMLKDSSWRSFLDMGRRLRFIKTVNLSDMRVVLGNGAEIIFRSVDNPERARGPNLSGAWLDEASLMDQEAYTIIIACLRERGEQGWLGATFTPRGRQHWTYEVFGVGKPNTALFHARTVDNPFLPPDFAATLRAQYPTQFARQELEGEFVELQGNVFRREWFRVIDAAPEGLRWVRYWDLAASINESADYCASVA